MKKTILGVACFCVASVLLPAASWAQEEGPLTGQALLDDAARRNSAVAVVLEMPRQSPAEILSAVFTLIDLGEERVADEVLRPLLGQQIDEADRAKLVGQFGTARFMKLVRLDRPTVDEAEKNPPFAGARKFAQDCLKAASDAARDPERIARLITQLNDANPANRNAARIDLKATGIDGAVACLEVLASIDQHLAGADATDEQKDHRARVMAVLVSMHPVVDDLLLAALADSRGVFGRDLAEMVGHLRLSSAVPHLAHLAACGSDEAAAGARHALARMGISTPTPEEARALAEREIDRLLSMPVDSRLAATNDADTHIWWTWTASDENTPGRLTSHQYTATEVQTLAAARLARILIGCGTPSPRQQRLALSCLWQTAAAAEQTLPPSVEELARDISTEELSTMLAESVRYDRMAAAIAAAELLGERGDRAAVASEHGRPSPLAQALGSADARLRYAALEAVMKISPRRSFAGRSQLPDALWDFAVGSGPAQAVVISPVVERAGTWAGQLRGLGYDAVQMRTGREGLQAVIDSPRLAMVIVDGEVNRPPAGEVLYQMRGITHAGRTPTALVCNTTRLMRFERLARDDRFLLATVRPTSEERLVEVAEQLKALADPPLADEAVRTDRARQALEWLAELLDSGRGGEQLRRREQVAMRALYQPGLTEPALAVLTHLGTAGSQQTLADYASARALPIENRRAALAAFTASVKKFGMQLTSSQIDQQYHRYNSSESADGDTQKVLGDLLDVLEQSGRMKAE